MGGPCWVEGHGQPEITDNFHVQRFVFNGVEFYCVEQAFQALKFKDPSHQATVSSLRPEPGARGAAFGLQCFRGGQARLASFRTEWDGLKAEVMYRASRAKYIQNTDSASQLLATGEAAITRPDDPDGFWSLWNCYIQKRIRIELKPPTQRSQSENETLKMIESKFDLQAAIFGGEETINSSEFNTSCPKAPYAYEGAPSGPPPQAEMRAPLIGDARPSSAPTGEGGQGGRSSISGVTELPRPRRRNRCPCCSTQ